MRTKNLSLLLLCIMLCNVMLAAVPAFADTDPLAYDGPISRNSDGSIKLVSNGADQRVKYETEALNPDVNRLTLVGGWDYHCREFATSSSISGNSGSNLANLATYNNGGLYAQWDFGQALTLHRFKIFFENNANVTKYNRVAKEIRIEYSDDGTTWSSDPVADKTGGAVPSNMLIKNTDFSNPADVGAEAAAAYARLTAPDSLNSMDDMALLPAFIDWEFEPFTARYARVYFIQPTQDGTLIDTDGKSNSKVKFRRPSWFDAGSITPPIDHSTNQVDASYTVPFEDYTGRVVFARRTSQNANIGYAGEAAANMPVSRISYKTFEGTSGSPHEIIGLNPAGASYAIKGTRADFATGGSYITVDLGKETLLDRIDIKGNVGKYYEAVATNIPKSIRVDTGALVDGEIVWTNGSTATIDLNDPASVGQTLVDNYAMIKANPAGKTYSQLAAIAAEIRTPTEEAQYQAYLSMPTVHTVKMENPTESRFYRIVPLMPRQEEFTAAASFSVYNLTLIDSSKRTITADWNAAKVVTNAYGSSAYGGGKTAFPNGVNHTDSDSANRAFDSNASYFWKSGAGYFTEYADLKNEGEAGYTPWVIIDLGQKYNIDKIRLDSAKNISGFSIQSAELDGNPWGLPITTAAYVSKDDITDLSNTKIVEREYDDFVAQYVRFYFTQDVENVEIREIGVYGTPYVSTEFTLDDITVTHETEGALTDTLYSGALTVTASFTNTLETEGKGVTLIAVLYDNTGALMSLKYVSSDTKIIPLNASGADKEVSTAITVPQNPEDYQLRVFIWDSFAGVKPIITNGLTIQ